MTEYAAADLRVLRRNAA